MNIKDPWKDNSGKQVPELVVKNDIKYLDGPSDYIIFILAILSGVLVWFFSPELTGHDEPWDFDGPGYFIILFISGFILGVVKPMRYYRWAVAIFIGHLIGLIFVGMGVFILLGILYIAVSSFISFVGASIGASASTALFKKN